MNIDKFWYGAVIKLTREDKEWDIERIFNQMEDAGLNTAVIWPSSFWWEEEKEGYPFNTGKRVLELAEKHNIQVIMELAGQQTSYEYIPDYLMKDEYYAIDKNGNRICNQQAYGFLNYFHPEVNQLICQHFIKTAEAYKEYAALCAYDLFNETVFYSYDSYTLEQFQIWLRSKYRTIVELNRVWERTYRKFSEITPSSWKWLSIMPEADFMAFQRAAIHFVLKKWSDAIKSVDAIHPLIADNIDSMVTSPAEHGKDDFALKEVVDEIGMSFYPKQVGGCSAPAKRWLALDSFYAASRREGFFISEMQTHTQAMFNPTTSVEPCELKLWCYEGLAAGAKGLIYWMWRPFSKGMQTLGRGLVDYKNRKTQRLEFAEKFSELVSQTGILAPVKPKTAILYDPLNEIFQKCYTEAYPIDQNIYLDSVSGAYRAMFDIGISCDVIRLGEICDYKLVILTNQIVIGRETAQVLEEYVRSGGILICDGKIGIVDEHSALNENLPGGDFYPCIGHKWRDMDVAGLDFIYKGKKYSGFYSKDIVELTDGECVGWFEDGKPAIIVKKYGKGRVITFNTYLWYGYFKGIGNANELLSELADNLNFWDYRITNPLKARFSENQTNLFVFIFNYTDKPVKGHISGYGFDEDIIVESYDVMILDIKKEKTAEEE